jgi:hypothetical protein
MTETPMFVHVITLAFGLIIAFGLQQIVALFQRRKRERQAAAEPPSTDNPA